MTPQTWTVTGQALVEPEWEPVEGVWLGAWADFEVEVDAATLAEARWQVRRRFAPGHPVCELEDLPPGRERRIAEVRHPEIDREADYTGAELAEYERLTLYVRIKAVTAAVTEALA